MPYEKSLPFGRTDVTESEIEDAVQIDDAVQILEENNLDSPAGRVEGFIESVPAMLGWLEKHGRNYPWRNTTDPWEVYMAEILLQRTRADAVSGVYPDFVELFPGPDRLHSTSESEIRETVEELGFVNHRIKTLQDVASIFCTEYDGAVPESIQELKRPWRVGDYAARGCQLFARGVPVALVDVNIARVIGRVLRYDMPDQPHKSEEVYELVGSLVPDSPALARSFNLALLDLGALVCTSSDPDCEVCPLRETCAYYERRYE